MLLLSHGLESIRRSWLKNFVNQILLKEIIDEVRIH